MIKKVVVPVKPKLKDGVYTFQITKVYRKPDGSLIYPTYTHLFLANEVQIRDLGNEYELIVDIDRLIEFKEELLEIMLYPVLETNSETQS